MHCLDELYASIASRSEAVIRATAQRVLHPDVEWHVAHPINDLQGVDAVIEAFLLPLARALPDLERKPFIALEGDYEGRDWCDGTGYFVGTFAEPLLGIAPTGKTLYLRYTEMVCTAGGQITQCYIIPDFLDVMMQAGCYPLRAPLGHAGLIMPPTTFDGVVATCEDAAYSATTRTLVMDMLACLGRYDGKALGSMDLENYWHEDFMWYGPGGIGTTRGISGFRQHHQGPFLAGFPDRGVDVHVNILAAGDYVATGGWPHMHGTHTGGDWLGLEPTGTALTLRVMDIWRREGDLLKENWVAIDIPDMLHQMGRDVFSS